MADNGQVYGQRAYVEYVLDHNQAVNNAKTQTDTLENYKAGKPPTALTTTAATAPTPETYKDVAAPTYTTYKDVSAPTYTNAAIDKSVGGYGNATLGTAPKYTTYTDATAPTYAGYDPTKNAQVSDIQTADVKGTAINLPTTDPVTAARNKYNDAISAYNQAKKDLQTSKDANTTELQNNLAQAKEELNQAGFQKYLQSRQAISNRGLSGTGIAAGDQNQLNMALGNQLMGLQKGYNTDYAKSNTEYAKNLSAIENQIGSTRLADFIAAEQQKQFENQLSKANAENPVTTAKINTSSAQGIASQGNQTDLQKAIIGANTQLTTSGNQLKSSDTQSQNQLNTQERMQLNQLASADQQHLNELLVKQQISNNQLTSDEQKSLNDLLVKQQIANNQLSSSDIQAQNQLNTQETMQQNSLKSSDVQAANKLNTEELIAKNQQLSDQWKTLTNDKFAQDNIKSQIGAENYRAIEALVEASTQSKNQLNTSIYNTAQGILADATNLFSKLGTDSANLILQLANNVSVNAATNTSNQAVATTQANAKGGTTNNSYNITAKLDQ